MTSDKVASFTRARYNNRCMSPPGDLILWPGTPIVTRNDANRMGGGQFIGTGAVVRIETFG
jgi:hypothetical protein